MASSSAIDAYEVGEPPKSAPKARGGLDNYFTKAIVAMREPSPQCIATPSDKLCLTQPVEEVEATHREPG